MPNPNKTRDGRKVGCICVRGTWETQREFTTRERAKADPTINMPAPLWYRPQSEFQQMLRGDYGITLVDHDADPDTENLPLWSGALNGTAAQGFFSRLFNVRDPDWMHGGERLKRLIQNVSEDYDALLIIAFSHGGQATAWGLAALPAYQNITRKLHMISVDMPIRSDQKRWYARAAERLNVLPNGDRALVHFHTSGVRVWVRWSGTGLWSILTGKGGKKKRDHATLNLPVAQHGCALYRPRERMSHWRTALSRFGIRPYDNTPSAYVPLIEEKT